VDSTHPTVGKFKTQRFRRIHVLIFLISFLFDNCFYKVSVIYETNILVKIPINFLLTGTFAVDTDHASVLDRQPDEWMEWDTISIKLAWLGFEDIHTDIDTYTINVGSDYMQNDLNKVNYQLELRFCN